MATFLMALAGVAVVAGGLAPVVITLRRARAARAARLARRGW